jgi:DNA polymerase-3 subunit delta
VAKADSGAKAPDLLTSITQGDLRPIYCLYGPERFLLDRCLDALREAVLGPGGDGAFQSDVFELGQTGIAPVLNAAQTLPMFAKRRLVIGHGLDQLKSEQLEPLSAYVRDPNPSTCLVLVGQKLDTRLRPFPALRKAGFLHEFERLRDQELVVWIRREATRRAISMDGDVAHTLAEVAGPDLGRVAQAIEQLALYAGTDGGKTIRREHVLDLIAETRERTVFELIKAIAAGDLPEALGRLRTMLRHREPPLRIQFMLARHLRQVWRAKELVQAGASRGDIASAIGISPYFLDDVLVPARRLSEAALRRSFQSLCRTDQALKSSRIDPETQIAHLVQTLTTER